MPADTTRFFLTYRGVRLPLALSEELEPASARHRGTFFRASYDADDQLVRVEKVVYGEVELEHVYDYDATGHLRQATITTPDDEPKVLSFDP